MGVVRHEAIGLGDDGAVGEFVVVGVAGHEPELEVGCAVEDVGGVGEDLEEEVGSGTGGEAAQDFLVFEQDFGRDAESRNALNRKW